VVEHYMPDVARIRSWDHRVAELRIDGELQGHLACVVMTLGFTGDGAPWPWFVVVLPDGTKEPSEEDYGPDWWVVRDLDAGHYTREAEGTTRPRRLLGRRVGTVYEPGPEVTYDVTWLDEEASREAWQRLGLTDRDF